MVKICTQCGNEYQRIGQHWSLSSDCSHPSFTDHQREVITGLLMGDGCIHKAKNGNPYLVCSMISENYLQHIDDQFGVFGNVVSLKMTAAESAEHVRETGFDQNADADDYQDLYRWRSIRHPELQEFADWYASGKKVWPESIELTPTVLKHWYCGDGNWNNSGTNNYIRIAMANEVNNTDKVNQLFENAGLPSPSNYDISENNCIAEFTVDKSRELWQYMGEPLPDFEYKWPEQYRQK